MILVCNICLHYKKTSFVCFHAFTPCFKGDVYILICTSFTENGVTRDLPRETVRIKVLTTLRGKMFRQ
jgi:hypothetical protein